MKNFCSEFFGTLFLLSIVVGSGIMAETLSVGNLALALLINSIATGAGLFVLIQSLGHLSGAHFNPVVSFIELLWGRIKLKDFFIYVFAQISGAIVGVLITHIMFDLEIFQLSTKLRTGLNLGFSEFIATFGLISTIYLAGKKHVEFVPLTIALYITSAYWFTSSSAFANPAVTFARVFTDTYAGISPDGVLTFISGQFLGALSSFLLFKLTRSNII